MFKFSAEEGCKVNRISDHALSLLMKYEWPGNIRQLENAIYRAVILAENEELDVAEFPQIAARVEEFEIEIPPAPIIKLEPAEEKEFTPVETEILLTAFDWGKRRDKKSCRYRRKYNSFCALSLSWTDVRDRKASGYRTINTLSKIEGLWH